MKEIGGRQVTEGLAKTIVEYWKKQGFSKIVAKAALQEEVVPAHQKKTKDGELVDCPAAVITLWVVKSNLCGNGYPPS